MPSSLAQIHLDPVRPDHLAELYRWSTNPAASFHWRFGGATPEPERFREAVWSNVLCQFLATDSDGVHHGLVVCYGPDHANGHAYFAVQGNPSRQTGTAAMVGLLQLVDHVFRHWPFRKLYADVPGFNASEFSGALRHLVVEATLRDHVFYDGRFWDQVTYALYRDVWFDTIRPRFSRLLEAPSLAAATV